MSIKLETFRDVLDLWPNMGALAQDIDEKPITIRVWRHRNSIPPRKFGAIVQAAAKWGFDGVTLFHLTGIHRNRWPRRASADAAPADPSEYA